MRTKYSIHNGRIYGPVSYTGFFIAKDGHIHDIKGDTGYRVDEGRILGPQGDTRFRIEDNRIFGPTAQPPWSA